MWMRHHFFFLEIRPGEFVWFWFHFAVQHEQWVLVMCLFGLGQRGETLHRKTTVSNTSYSPNLPRNKERIKTGDAKFQYKIATSMNIQVSLMMEGESRISFQCFDI